MDIDTYKNAIGTALPEDLKAFFRKMQALGAPLYIVGGLVRDILLGLEVNARSDIDICGPLHPDMLVPMALELAGVKHHPRSAALGTVALELPAESGGSYMMEYTAFRRDSYRGGGHRPVSTEFVATAWEDALRRDFTCNAVYYHPAAGELIDPLDGLSAIEERRLVATRPAGEVFSEDGLRIMRLARFAATLGFSVADDALEAAAASASLLRDVATERIRDELTGLLLCDLRPPLPLAPAPDLLYGLRLLHRTGALAVVLPPLAQGDGVIQSKKWHAYDVLEHAFHVCAASEPDLALRLTGLLHDVGKPFTLDERGRMIGHDKLGAQMAEKLLGPEGLHYNGELVRRVCRLIGVHMFDLSGQAREKTLRRAFAKMGRETAYDLIKVRRADVIGSGIREEEPEVCARWRRVLSEMESDGAPFSVAELQIDGRRVMELTGLPPSSKIGELLARLLLYAAAAPGRNNPQELERALKSMV
ncbi:MAG: HD domain-containing protein [Christensenellales bacterium]